MSEDRDVILSGPRIQVSREMLDDALDFGAAMTEAWDRHFRPWRYPDRPRWPETFTLLPRLARFTAWIERRRASGADQHE